MLTQVNISEGSFSLPDQTNDTIIPKLLPYTVTHLRTLLKNALALSMISKPSDQCVKTACSCPRQVNLCPSQAITVVTRSRSARLKPAGKGCCVSTITIVETPQRGPLAAILT